MDKEFEELYNKWNSETGFLSHRDFLNEPGFVALLEWSREHKKEAVESIREILMGEPSFVVHILDELFDHPLTCEGYIPLDYYCNGWLALLDFYDSGEKDTGSFSMTKDYYKDWREYQEYMKHNYIAWNPFKENDPNVTLEEFKSGKRNNPNYNRPIQFVQLKEENFKNN